MGIERPLDLSVFQKPPEQAETDSLPFIAIQMCHHQDVDNIEVVRNAVDMFSVPTKLIRAANAIEHDLSRPFEEPRLVVEGELVIDEPEPKGDAPGPVLDLSKIGQNACAVTERPKPFVRYIYREERLVRVECAGIRADSVPTLTRRWAHIVESQLVRPGEVPEMVVEQGADENGDQAGGPQVREVASELGGG